MILPLSIPSPTFQFFQIGPLRIYAYALWIILGIILAAVWTSRRLTRRGAERGVVFDFVVWSVLLGIVGARLYHVLTHWGDYFIAGKQWWNPFEANAIWNIWDGGIAIFGALLGGGIGVLIASRLTGVRFASFADALVPGLLLAQAFGRMGNYFNHELFGGPTTLPWGLEIEASNPAFPIGLPAETLFHPTFLYEIVWNVLGIIVLLAIERRWHLRWGRFFALYLVWYGVGRAIIESMRVDPSLLILGMRTNVFTALLAIALGVVLFFVIGRRHVGIETSVYLPGRHNPNDSVLFDTANSDDFYHVIDHGDAVQADSETAGESAPDRPETAKAE